ncbi:MAG: bifunctional demethylmenaquinone methyltransferase/2-methoxy-6-polyprenyl-1,4-benzoquinol methylase UbiE [Candidatus Kryptonium sp.]|nr:bifunctional demethylmenaquinone methyltransferase/2-methoxy-6-polyprenyl-1,4-benzoquinol methylase UbiE [Candidatus Kryptonium sp.]MCX7762244.1 bifunctional demethylmenaquinone methyltransferase/2-methoxy-6-polyprenyl-1,4-benzoquinol methylase UbiE [Candidatus Kryptonium sp.]MDW8109321.1 bifunctional demethylmenaquinone methyltransferase/2-methoxy-6-polyprenyl-1,4-benzoquinol methylase UbiE [Candidatus Kryptonium sp.]
MQEIKSYITQGEMKRKYVKRMFNAIAKRYDFLNHLLSFGLDIHWRRFAIKKLNLSGGETIVDIACGTGDFSISARDKFPSKIIGVDVSLNMLKIFSDKAKKFNLNNLSLLCAEAENLPLKDKSVDVVLVAFGVRNFSNLEMGLKEIRRVLRDNGKLAVLEFSLPKGMFGKVYLFYFRKILPFIGNLISKHENAYTYLPESVLVFPEGEEFTKILSEVGFKKVEMWRLTFGVVTLYIAFK